MSLTPSSIQWFGWLRIGRLAQFFRRMVLFGLETQKGNFFGERPN